MPDSIGDIANNRYRQSIEHKNLNNRLSIATIDYLTNDIREKLGDNSIGSALIGKALKFIGEAQIRSIAIYTLSHSNTPGRAFVKICTNEINKKA